MLEQLAMTAAVNCILGSISCSCLPLFPSSLLTLPPPFSLSPLLPLEHLELVAAQTIRQLLFWRVKQHRRTNVEHSALQQRQRGSLRARKRAREVRVHRRCPFERNIIRLIWSSLKLWSISRFTAPKCRKFAHSFGSLVGNLSKSIIHIYMYIVLYTILYIYIYIQMSSGLATPSFHVHQAKPSDCKLAMQSFQFPSCGCHHKSKWRKVSWIKRIKGAARGWGRSHHQQRGVEGGARQGTL